MNTLEILPLATSLHFHLTSSNTSQTRLRKVLLQPHILAECFLGNPSANLAQPSRLIAGTNHNFSD